MKELAVWAEDRGWTVSLQGRKIYAVPKPLTKSAAVREVARRTGADLTLAAGDSLLDADLLLAADRGWRPGHGELADAGWTAPPITALPERGVAAGERILREFLGVCAGRGPRRWRPPKRSDRHTVPGSFRAKARVCRRVPAGHARHLHRVRAHRLTWSRHAGQIPEVPRFRRPLPAPGSERVTVFVELRAMRAIEGAR